MSTYASGISVNPSGLNNISFVLDPSGSIQMVNSNVNSSSSDIKCATVFPTQIFYRVFNEIQSGGNVSNTKDRFLRAYGSKGFAYVASPTIGASSSTFNMNCKFTNTDQVGAITTATAPSNNFSFIGLILTILYDNNALS